MATTRTWDPFGEMLRMRESMNRLTESAFPRAFAPTLGYAESLSAQAFPLNIYGTAEDLHVEALLPGVGQDEVQIDIDRSVLTITAQRQGTPTGEGQNWHLREFNPGRFTRSIALPFPVDVAQASATFTNGVLSLTLPKAEEAKPRRIQLGSSQTQLEALTAGRAQAATTAAER